MRWVALPLLCVCACSCGRAPSSDYTAGEESGPHTDTSTESSGDDLPPVADMPQQDMCVKASGEKVELSDAVWQIAFDEPQKAVLLAAGSAYLGARLSDAEWRLSVVELESGARQQSDHPLPAGNVANSGSLFWTPNNELLHFQLVESHQLIVQRFSGVDLIDAVALQDDHTRVGWDGGSVLWTMVKPEDNGFVLLGKTRGDDEPNGLAREVVWKKNYLYGEVLNQGTDFQWEERDARGTSPGRWIGEDAIFAEDDSFVRIDGSGVEIWRVTDNNADHNIFLFDGSDDSLLWRHPVSSELHDDWPSVAALSFLDTNQPDALDLVWKDNHCVRRVIRGGLVRGGSEIVVVAGGTAPDDTIEMWFHRLSREGEMLDTKQFIVPDGTIVTRGSVFETEDSEIGILMDGLVEENEGFSGLAALFFPFG